MTKICRQVIFLYDSIADCINSSGRYQE